MRPTRIVEACADLAVVVEAKSPFDTLVGEGAGGHAFSGLPAVGWSQRL